MNITRKKNKRSFNLNDYQSNDGMLTTIWGPPMWHYLHTMSFNYPIDPKQTDKKHYREFVLKLQYVLPCGKCRENLKNNFKKLPLKKSHMKSRNTFSRYIYDLHELINHMLGKTSGLSYEDVRDRYEHFRSRCGNFNKTKKVKENGCTEPLNGKKSRCILHIVPKSKRGESLKIDKLCEHIKKY